MNANADRLEHLFTRALDGAASHDERDLLDTLLRDESVRARFEAYAALDDAVGGALRADFDRAAALVVTRRLGWRIGRALAMGVAACIATLIWLYPPPLPTPDHHRPQQAGSWFAPMEPPHDAVETLPATFERPQARVRGTERHWIVVPGDEPGQFMIVEVDRVRTEVTGLYEDY